MLDGDRDVAYLVCRRCGHVYQSPRLGRDELAAFYAMGYRELRQGTEGPTAKDLAMQTARARLTVGLVEKAFRESPVGRIAVHVDQDAGSALPSMPCFGLAAETRATFVRLKGENFDASRESVFHYAVLANRVPLIDSCKHDVLGQALGLDTDFVLAFARLRHDGDSRIAAVFMHELGHNLGLTHEVYKGIDSSCTHPGYACYDPDLYANYESVMNYHFQRAFGSSSHWRLGYSDGAHGTDRYGNPDFDDWGNLVFASVVMRF